jgi:endonuclease-3 related protein
MASCAKIYSALYAAFGPQRWWPADSAFEVMVGAILTQNTSWTNVEKAIANIKKEKSLSARRLFSMTPKRLGGLIRSAGYFNIKARRLQSFLDFFIRYYRADVTRMALVDTALMRQQLLSVNGIGPETADSILLYALGKPVFVVDAYTKRILSRHRLISEQAGYDQVQRFFLKHLKKDARLCNEYHALLVKLGKEFCLRNKPRCPLCPLKQFLKPRFSK